MVHIDPIRERKAHVCHISEYLYAWNAQQMYAVPRKRTYKFPDDTALKLNGIQTPNALKVRENQCFKDFKFC
jgi:hypothetical protein